MTVTITFGNNNGQTYVGDNSTMTISTGDDATAAKIAFSQKSVMLLDATGQQKGNRFKIGTLTVGDTFIQFDCNPSDPFNGTLTFYLVPTKSSSAQIDPVITLDGFDASGDTITVQWDVTVGRPGNVTIGDGNMSVPLQNYRPDFTPDP